MGATHTWLHSVFCVWALLLRVWASLLCVGFTALLNIFRCVGFASVCGLHSMCGLHSLASLRVLCVGFASLCSVCGLHSVVRVWVLLLFASLCIMCLCMASLCVPYVGFVSSNVSAVSDYSVRLSCMRPLLSLVMQPLLLLAMRLAIPHCMSLIMHATWHGTPCYAYMWQGTHTSSSLCGTSTSSLTCDETGHSTLRDTHDAWHMAWHTLLSQRPLLSLVMRLAIPHCVALIMHGT